MLTATDTVHDISTQLSNMINYRAGDNLGQVGHPGVFGVADAVFDAGMAAVA
jgi:hypothetical protein